MVEGSSVAVIVSGSKSSTTTSTSKVPHSRILESSEKPVFSFLVSTTFYVEVVGSPIVYENSNGVAGGVHSNSNHNEQVSENVSFHSPGGEMLINPSRDVRETSKLYSCSCTVSVSRS